MATVNDRYVFRVTPIDDSHLITIQVESTGDLIIKNVVCDHYVELNTPFMVQYTVENKLPPKEIYGALLNMNTGLVCFHSFWSDVFTGEKNVSYFFERGTTTNLALEIRVGET